jgi:hypothetical protein
MVAFSRDFVAFREHFAAFSSSVRAWVSRGGTEVPFAILRKNASELLKNAMVLARFANKMLKLSARMGRGAFCHKPLKTLTIFKRDLPYA